MVRVGSSVGAAQVDSMDGIRIEASAQRTSATWSPVVRDSSSVTILAGDKDREAVRASIVAVRSLTPRAAVTTRRASVVFPGAPTRGELAGRAAPIDSAWHGDLMLALARDQVLASTAEGAVHVAACEAAGTVVMRNANGETIASVASVAGAVVVFACVEPGSLAGTALVAGVESALTPPLAMQELEPNVLPDEVLRRWERPALEVPPKGQEETSPDGRWFWLLALGFLVVEEWLRRRTPRRKAPAVNEVPNERVA
jgi:hypothetical protein